MQRRDNPSRIGEEMLPSQCGVDVDAHAGALFAIVLLAGQNVRKLIKDGFVIRKPTKIHSRARARLSAEAKAKGRHTGYGEHGQYSANSSGYLSSEG